MASMTVVIPGFGGVIQGQFGTYQMASNGTWTIDVRDYVTLQAIGARPTSLGAKVASFSAPLAAATGKLIASTSLANGSLTIANQPDVTRQGQVIMGAGTVATTAGSVSITYSANDGTMQTDTFSAVMAASGTFTGVTSKGVVSISSASVSGMSGGASPFIYVSTTDYLGLPVDTGTISMQVYKEVAGSTAETVGTLSPSSLGCIAPTTAPNGTLNFSFNYVTVL